MPVKFRHQYKHKNLAKQHSSEGCNKYVATHLVCRCVYDHCICIDDTPTNQLFKNKCFPFVLVCDTTWSLEACVAYFRNQYDKQQRRKVNNEKKMPRRMKKNVK